jgi:hypothetical protein
MNNCDFYCVEAGSGSIKSLMKVPGVKRSDIKTHVYYTNVSGIAEGRNLEAESFNLAQMPDRITND